MFLFGRKKITGLDMGHSAVKIAESNNGKKITFLACYPIDNGISHSENSRSDQVKQIFKEITKDRSFTDKRIFNSVQDESVMVKYMELPLLSKEEMKTALPIETERVIPFNLDEIIVNYKKVSVLSDDPGKMGITAAVIPKKLLDHRKDIFTVFSSNHVEKMTIPSTMAFEKINHYSAYFNKNHITVFIDIGAKFTNISLGRNNEIYHSRFFSHGVIDFNEAFMKSKRSDMEKADKIRRNYYIGKDRDIYFIASLEIWAKEVKRTLEYYRRRLTTVPLIIDKVLLSGGGSLMNGMKEYVEKISETETHLDKLEIPGIDAIRKKQNISPDELALFKVVLGLAL